VISLTTLASYINRYTFLKNYLYLIKICLVLAGVFPFVPLLVWYTPVSEILH